MLIYMYLIFALAGHDGDAGALAGKPYKDVAACKKDMPRVQKHIIDEFQQKRGAKVEFKEKLCISKEEVMKRLNEVSERMKKQKEDNSI